MFILKYNVVVPDPKSFFEIAASIPDAASVNPSGTKMLLANGLSTFPIKCQPVFSNGQDAYLKMLLIFLF